MLNFYINGAGRGLPKRRRAKLEAAKDELRELYGKQRKAGLTRRKQKRQR